MNERAAHIFSRAIEQAAIELRRDGVREGALKDEVERAFEFALLHSEDI